VVALITFNILGVPEGADSLRDWIVWTAAIIGGLVAIGVGVYKIAVWLKGALASAGYDLLEPKFDEAAERTKELERKIDGMRVANETQHSVVEVAIDALSSELHQHQEALIAHLEESAIATEQLRIVAQAVETHIGQLREEITSPGLPVTPGPLTPLPPGPPPGRKMMF
jgi:hypothetical protein